MSEKSAKSANTTPFAEAAAVNATVKVRTTVRHIRDFSRHVCRCSGRSGDKKTPLDKRGDGIYNKDVKGHLQ